MFELSEEELQNWRSKFGTSNFEINMGLRYKPFAFTEQGVAQLSSVLNSDRAIAVNIKIIRIFTKMRNFLSDHLSLRLEIEDIKKKMNNHDKNIELVFSYLDELVDKKEDEKERTKIGFKKEDN